MKKRILTIALMALVMLLYSGSALAYTRYCSKCGKDVEVNQKQLGSDACGGYCPDCGSTLPDTEGCAYHYIDDDCTKGQACILCGRIDSYYNYNNPNHHDWGSDIIYEWSDGNRTCTASRQCARMRPNGSCCKVKQTAQATVQTETDEDGNTVYIATFSETWAEERRKTVEPSHTHSYKTVVTAPTCTESGYTTYTCTICGSSFTTYDTDTTGHDYKAVVTAPTCTEDGYTTYTCSGCGDTYIADEVKATGHDYKATVTEPTCTKKGYTTYTCANCGDKYTADEISAKGHDYKATVTKPTCTKSGYTTYTCTVCGDKYTADKVKATGHDYKATVTKPTCTKNGYTTYTCENCGKSYTGDKTDKLGHTLGEWQHTGEGVHAAECLREGCNYVLEGTCAQYEYSILASTEDEEDTVFTLCPICGYISDDEQLDLIADVTVQKETEFDGEAILRMGTLKSGEAIISVCFENDGQITQPIDTVTISLPADTISGCSLVLLSEDGTESVIEICEENDVVSFVLDYTVADGEEATPLRVIRLVEAETEA